VVHVEPYRVVWYSAGGRVTVGRPIAVPAVPATDREKCFTLQRRGATGRCNHADIPAWPRAVPAFQPNVSLGISVRQALLPSRTAACSCSARRPLPRPATATT
jgi:hypothetical protein